MCLSRNCKYHVYIVEVPVVKASLAYPVALRKVKVAYNFGLSEGNRVNKNVSGGFVKSYSTQKINLKNIFAEKITAEVSYIFSAKIGSVFGLNIFISDYFSKHIIIGTTQIVGLE